MFLPKNFDPAQLQQKKLKYLDENMCNVFYIKR